MSKTWREALAWSSLPLVSFLVAVFGTGWVAEGAWVLFFLSVVLLIAIGVWDTVVGAREMSEDDRS